MHYFVYILKSVDYDRYYIGQTQEMEQRLKRHNSGYVRSTKAFSPWQVIKSIQVDTRSEAMKLERKLKNLKSHKRLLEYIETI